MTVLKVEAIVKHFGGVHALRGVSLDVEEGEILALLGLNGAGKSTLVKILAGDLRPDGGRMTLCGRDYAPHNVAAGQSLGVSVVHQQRTVIPQLTVAQNLYLGDEPRAFGVVDENRMIRDATTLFQYLDVQLDPRLPVSQLSAGQQQVVDIAKAIKREAKVLILDEPTAALSQHEAQRLFEVVRNLRDRGMSAIFVSHRLDEVFALCDRIAVMADGVVAAARPISEVSKQDVVRWMVKKSSSSDPVMLPQLYGGESAHNSGSMSSLAPRIANDVASLARVVFIDHASDLPAQRDLEVRAGEVVGLAGQLGAGCTQVLECLAGHQAVPHLCLEVRGRRVTWRSPADAIANRVVLVPENRTLKAVAADLSVRENISLPSLGVVTRMGWVNQRRERQAVRSICDRFSVVMPGIDESIKALSGGNQQKAVFAKWLMAVREAMSGGIRDSLFLLDEPTEGVDVKTKPEIAQEIRQLAADGAGVLMASSDAEELLGTCDRIYVMVKGRVIGDYLTDSLNTQSLSALTMAVEPVAPELVE